MSFEVLGFNFFFLWLYKYGGVVLSVGQTILVVVCPVLFLNSYWCWGLTSLNFAELNALIPALLEYL